MILNSPYISGSLIVTGNITACGGITISGSVASASYALNSTSASYALNATSASYASSATSASYAASTTSASYAANSTSASFAGDTVLFANRASSTFANTGSNTFDGGAYFSSSFNPTGFSTTASLYTDGGLRVSKDAYISGTLYLNNVTVYGTQSVAYITSSQLNISTNLISVNTDTPSVRFGGLAVYDSGSTGLTGSILWDSENNRWIYSNPSGSSYSGGMFISGPRTSTLGSETGTTSCMLLAGQGGDHLTSSMIYHDSTVTCIPNTLAGNVACFSGTVCSPSFISTGTSCFGGCINIFTCNQIRLYNSAKNNWLQIESPLIAGDAAIDFKLTTQTGAVYINNTGIACFNSRVCSSGISSNASIVLNESAPINFSGTGGYISMYSRRAGGSCGNILYSNGTGQNLWFGEVGANVYAIGTGGTGTDYSGTPLLNLDLVNQRIGIGTSIPDIKFDVCSTVIGSELMASFRSGANANNQYTALRIGNGNKFAYLGMMLQPADVAYFHTACNPFTNSNGIYLTEAGKVGIGLCQPKSRLDLAVPTANTSAGCFNASTINLTDPTTVGAYSQITFGYTEGRVYAASYIGYVSLSSWSGGYGDLVFGTRNCGNDTQPTEKLRITGCNSIVGYSQWYTSYTAQRATPNGGINTVRILEDALGQWVQVGRFSCDASLQIGNTFSSVTGMSTVTCQTAQTQFSSDWGGGIPTEIRILGATDFDKWRETRTIDFVYRNIPGRPWCLFFNGGNTDGNYTTTGIARYGFNTCGTYDGFGRWNSPNNCMIGMSDGAYCNPSSAYTTPTSNAFNWYTTQDAKLTAIANNTVYSGQDGNWTTGFGYDDGTVFFNDVYPNTTSQGGPATTYSSAVWILLKFN